MFQTIRCFSELKLNANQMLALGIDEAGKVSSGGVTANCVTMSVNSPPGINQQRCNDASFKPETFPY